MTHTFGPIYSRRFGRSLGLNVLGDTKQCTMDCVYCELGKAKVITHLLDEPPSINELVHDCKNALQRHQDIDVLTITANGEPTLYPHLHDLIKQLKTLSGYKKLLILSNTTTIESDETQKALCECDIVKLSLDAGIEKIYKRIDRPIPFSFDNMIQGMIKFRHKFQGELVIEILVVKGINDTQENFDALNILLAKISPDRVDIGTIDRPPAYNVNPVDNLTLQQLASSIHHQNIALALRKESEKHLHTYNEDEILALLHYRPLTQHDVDLMFDATSQTILSTLVLQKSVKTTIIAGTVFYKIEH